MPKLSRSQQSPEENKTLHQASEVAGPDTEIGLQRSEDIAPVLRDTADFRKMRRAFCKAFQLQHMESDRL